MIHKRRILKIQKQPNQIHKNAKKIELQTQKDSFFAQVLKQMEAQFEENDFELFLEHLEFISIHNRRNRANQTVLNSEQDTLKEIQNNFFKSSTHELEQNQEENIFRRLQTNLFENHSKKMFQNRITMLRENHKRQCQITPKHKKNISNVSVSRKLLSVDNRMKKNYQRIRPRLLLNQYEESTFRVRQSFVNDKRSKTQRGARFKTQGPDGEYSQQKSIPHFFINEFFNRGEQRSTKCGKTFEEQRMECFYRDRNKHSKNYQ